MARTTAARGSWARDGTGSRAPRSGWRGAERSLKRKPWKAAAFGRGPGRAPSRNSLRTSSIHSFPFIH